MATKVKRIYAEIRSRLQATGYTYIPAAKVDSQTDSFPAVTYYPHPRHGIKTIEEDVQTPPSAQGGREDLYLIVEGHIIAADANDSLDELEDVYEAIRSEIFREKDPYLKDQSGDELARDYIIQTERHAHVPPAGESTAKAQAVIKIPFFEDS